MTDDSPGTVISFYSYKGGTGRTMALANVGWLLAAVGKRVLLIDWDLEAPGLHRYFEPFLVDPSLEHSRGVIDMVWDYSMEIASIDDPNDESAAASVIDEMADVRSCVLGVDWEFPKPGKLHLLPAGRQGELYAGRVNKLDWDALYRKRAGGRFIDAVRQSASSQYDFVLIDTRTGVSDTSGVCTVQMPDILVACFTVNNQSIDGCSGVVASAVSQRPDDPPLVYPVPTRIEDGESRRLESRLGLAQRRFNPFLTHLPRRDWERYWGEVQIPYRALFAYEELLVEFGEKQHTTGSVLEAMERLAFHVTAVDVTNRPLLRENERLRALRLFERGAQNADWQVADRKASRRLLAELSRAADLVNDDTPRAISTAREIAEAATEVGDGETAAEAYRLLRDVSAQAAGANEEPLTADHVRTAATAALEVVRIGTGLLANGEPVWADQLLADLHDLRHRAAPANRLGDAVDASAELLSHIPYDADVLDEVATTCWYDGQLERALVLLDDAEDFGHPKSAVDHSRGQVLAELGRFEEAVAPLLRAIGASDGIGSAYAESALAYCRWKLGRIEEARDLFELAESTTPKNAWLHLRLAECLEDVGDSEAAFERYNRALEADDPALIPRLRRQALARIAKLTGERSSG